MLNSVSTFLQKLTTASSWAHALKEIITEKGRRILNNVLTNTPTNQRRAGLHNHLKLRKHGRII